MSQIRKIALVPAYEPNELLRDVVESLVNDAFTVVIVNDGSSASCDALFSALSEKAYILTHTENKGKGRAIKTGLAFIQKRFGAQVVIVTVDADGQHKSKDALHLATLAAAHPDTLYLGSRQLSGDIPLRSFLGNSITRLIFRLSTGTAIYDTQTGLRAFHGALLPQLLIIEGDRYEYEMNMLLTFAKNKYKMKEETIETIYYNENSASHFQTIQDSLRIYKEIFKFSLASLAGFLTDFLAYTLLLALTGSFVFSNIVARIVSATLNYTLNKTLVFQSKSNPVKSAASYILLAICILAGNTLLLNFLITRLGVSSIFAKLITEVVFFFLSWWAQKHIVFRQPDTNTTPLSMQKTTLFQIGDLLPYYRNPHSTVGICEKQS